MTSLARQWLAALGIALPRSNFALFSRSANHLSVFHVNWRVFHKRLHISRYFFSSVYLTEDWKKIEELFGCFLHLVWPFYPGKQETLHSIVARKKRKFTVIFPKVPSRGSRQNVWIQTGAFFSFSCRHGKEHLVYLVRYLYSCIVTFSVYTTQFF